MTQRKKVTKQEAYEDLIARIKVGKFAIRIDDESGHGVCLYNQNVNGGCAIGRFIPASLYRIEMERRPVSWVFRDFPTVGSLFEDCESKFWDYLQSLHDRLATGENNKIPSIKELAREAYGGVEIE